MLMRGYDIISYCLQPSFLSMAFDYLVKPKNTGFYVVDCHMIWEFTRLCKYQVALRSFLDKFIRRSVILIAWK